MALSLTYSISKPGNGYWYDSRPFSDFNRFTCTCMYVVLRNLITCLRYTKPSPQSRWRTVPSPRGSRLWPLYTYSFLTHWETAELSKLPKWNEHLAVVYPWPLRNSVGSSHNRLSATMCFSQWHFSLTLGSCQVRLLLKHLLEFYILYVQLPWNVKV